MQGTKHEISSSSLNSRTNNLCLYGLSVNDSRSPNLQSVEFCRNLADTQDRGYLDVIDFTIGMYLIQGVMGGSILFIPTTLPPGLYQQAAGITSPTTSVQSQTSSPGVSFSPVRSSFVPQLTSTAGRQSLQPPQKSEFTAATPRVAPALPARPSGNFQPQANGFTASDWDVTSTEKASADRFFEALDTLKRGFIEGEAAVPFMLKSQLPGEVLAQIWWVAPVQFWPF
jgi:epidermal growth factor receptor substrate 15